MKTATVKTKKGDILATTRALLTVPLFVEKDEATWERLPCWTTTTPPRRRRPTEWSSASRDYAARLLSTATTAKSTTATTTEECMVIRLVVVALYAVMEPSLKTWVRQVAAMSETNDDLIDNDNDNDEQDDDTILLTRVAQRTWHEFLKKEKGVALPQWIGTVHAVARQCVFVSLPHPVAEYANHDMPRLGRQEWPIVADILQLQSTNTILSLMKQAQDKFLPQTWAVLVPDDDKFVLTQDCFPSTDLVLDPTNNQINFVANYDNNDDDSETHTASENGHDSKITLRVDQFACRADTMEERVRKIGAAGQPTCLCNRCRYEMQLGNNKLDDDDAYWIKDNLSVDQTMRLAHGYMAMGDLDRAQVLYQTVVDQQQQSTTATTTTFAAADAWHALGAILLSKGQFLAAQRTWKSAQTSVAPTATRHAGLELQWTKLNGYKYLDDQMEQQDKQQQQMPNYTTIAPNAFVTPVLSSDVCDQIFAWANTGTKWTKQRHYAVPTCDVPVHQVPPLLEWFNKFMTTTMRPLLARQFQSSQQYFIHDAFVVKYEAGGTSNHLPIHTDESTHSFVIALNDDYEGGGTYFYDTDQVVKLRKGEILSFRGDSMMHGGEAVSSGRRLIVAAFLYHDDDNDYDDDEQQGTLKASKEMSRKRPLPFCEKVWENKEAKPTFSFDFQISTS